MELFHDAASGTFTRDYELVAGTNRLSKMTIGLDNYVASFDAAGNMTGETTARHFEWDHSDRMRVYRTQTSGSEPSVHAHYLYDAGGQRVKKLVRKQGGQLEATIYVDGVFEHDRKVVGATTEENDTLHVMDGQSRIAMVRVGTAFSGDGTAAVKFHLGDHLGSSHVVVDDAGAVTNREEYTPYGETSFGSFERKRYRYTGRERDEESGLSYSETRYYSPWLCRWVSTDTIGMIDGPNLYTYVRNGPIGQHDPDGTQAKPVNDADKSIAQMTDVQLYRHLQGLPPAARADFAKAATGRFATRAWAMMDRYKIAARIYARTSVTGSEATHYGTRRNAACSGAHDCDQGVWLGRC